MAAGGWLAGVRIEVVLEWDDTFKTGVEGEDNVVAVCDEDFSTDVDA